MKNLPHNKIEETFKEIQINPNLEISKEVKEELDSTATEDKKIINFLLNAELE